MSYPCRIEVQGLMSFTRRRPRASVRTPSPDDIHPYHAERLLSFQMGLLLYDMTTATFILGVFALFGFSIVSILVPMMVAYAWLNVNLQVNLGPRRPGTTRMELSM